jgi:hypothetical protein
MMIYIYMSEEDPDISIKGLGLVFGVVFLCNQLHGSMWRRWG